MADDNQPHPELLKLARTAAYREIETKLVRRLGHAIDSNTIMGGHCDHHPEVKVAIASARAMQDRIVRWLRNPSGKGSDSAVELADEFADAMQQHDGQEQKQAICDLIDAINGPITNDWSGEQMTKDEAKRYVMGYNR